MDYNYLLLLYFDMDYSYSDSHSYLQVKDPLVEKFGELIRKIYNPKNFKAHVDPHELLQVTLTFLSHPYFYPILIYIFVLLKYANFQLSLQSSVPFLSFFLSLRLSPLPVVRDFK